MGLISDEEKLRRRESVESVLGTSAMEGQFPDTSTLALLERFEKGEFDQQGLSAAIDRHVEHLLAARAA